MTPLDITRPLLESCSVEGQICLKCGSRSLGLCAPLEAEGLNDMQAETERFSIEPREALFHQGDPARYTVTTGTARLVKLLADGRQAAIGFRFAGDLLGYASGAEYAFGAEALTPLTACRMERKRLENMFQRYPVLERRFRELAAQELAA
ncbi:MAG TPA: Crp/Fnr family transcriptional regulator, partial [Acetobacteraceae bacterium]|nr:Crp/Fnr family transcriptional regulator [Acetobacteraceae bacterium]